VLENLKTNNLLFMKKLLLLLLPITTTITFAQNISIPDANFKNYLVANTAINTNGDTEIQITEATGFTGTIDCNGYNISDLTGIEFFINLTHLFCNDNQLTSLNVSNNTALNWLFCYNNQLISLDVSNNVTLTYLDCDDNKLTGLDLSNNIALDELYCGDNQLTSLNISNNTVLNWLGCDNNQLTNLNVSNNTTLVELRCNDNQLTSLDVRNGNNNNLTNFSAIGNPNLNCILVDDTAWSTANWTNIDATATFVNNSGTCNALSTENFELNNNFTLYPNPTVSNLKVSFNGKIDKIEVYSILGERVIETKKTVIPTASLSQGVYLVKLYAKSKFGMKRFIKQ